jgi:ATP-dependent helicase HrpB
MADVALPIDPLLPEIVATLRGAKSLVLEAPPGAGKTTRVPRALLEAGLGQGKEIVVLQPRRLPTRLAAQRVSEEIGERVGETVGYQVRFEDVRGPKTRLSFVTEGVLGRRLLSDPTLRDVGVVVLDEFHERHLSADISLALLRRLQQGPRPDLKLVVMSATLEAAPISAYLGNCPTLRSEGRRFDVSLEYLPTADDRYLDAQVLSGIKRLHANGLDGDVLVFLPGAGEIRRAKETCAEFAERHGIDLLPLHGDLPPAEQDRAVRRGSRRKIILSTNVAETSVTIDGVAAVIDSGLARVASHSPWSGLPILKLAKVSRASATQRAGRAGRTRSGHCLRLYTQHDFDGRPDQDAPEIRRMDLAETVLALRASGITDLASFPFFEPPPAASLEAAETLLRRLGAVASQGTVTEIGQRLLRFPLHPRQARIIVEGERRGVGADAALLAALVGERDIRREARTNLSGPGRAANVVAGPSDLLELLERFREAERSNFSSGRVQSLSLEAGAVQAVDRVQRQLRRAVREQGKRPSRSEEVEQALMLSVLAGYPDRVARRRKARSPELLLFGGGTAQLSEVSVVQEPELMVAVDALAGGSSSAWPAPWSPSGSSTCTPTPWRRWTPSSGTPTPSASSASPAWPTATSSSRRPAPRPRPPRRPRASWWSRPWPPVPSASPTPRPSSSGAPASRCSPRPSPRSASPPWTRPSCATRSRPCAPGPGASRTSTACPCSTRSTRGSPPSRPGSCPTTPPRRWPCPAGAPPRSTTSPASPPGSSHASRTSLAWPRGPVCVPAGCRSCCTCSRRTCGRCR